MRLIWRSPAILKKQVGDGDTGPVNGREGVIILPGVRRVGYDGSRDIRMLVMNGGEATSHPGDEAFDAASVPILLFR